MPTQSLRRAAPGVPGRCVVPSNGATVRVLSCKTARPNVLDRSSIGRDVVCEAHAKYPPDEGLVGDSFEDKDACGVGFVGELSKQPTRKCITDALGMLVRMTHRGACGCEENTGESASCRASQYWRCHLQCVRRTSA